MTLSFILGGARSGKSRYAAALATRLSPRPVYLATSRVWDDDHRARIQRHQADRGPEWRTIEEPLWISQVELSGEVVVVDCVTLWLTNFFVDAKQDVDACLAAAAGELERALSRDNHYIIVSNELGQGLHAETAVGRKFTDLQGLMNQRIAARATRVALMVAGIPLYVKGAEPSP
jgi:adenosylcobinamide kinase/adenosylcobinamide-phosphate guanylyltransferase